ncbi:MAG: hypothetical protein ACK559_04090, partial [bacterium]
MRDRLVHHLQEGLNRRVQGRLGGVLNPGMGDPRAALREDHRGGHQRHHLGRVVQRAGRQLGAAPSDLADRRPDKPEQGRVEEPGR